MNVLIMYDISNNKRRRKCEKVLSSYGYRVNYSVFELILTNTQVRDVIALLEKESNKELDHIRVYILNQSVINKSFIINKKDDKIFDEQKLLF